MKIVTSEDNKKLRNSRIMFESGHVEIHAKGQSNAH